MIEVSHALHYPVIGHLALHRDLTRQPSCETSRSSSNCYNRNLATSCPDALSQKSSDP